MKDYWKDTENINKDLGDSLDVDKMWAHYKKDKKKRPLLIWWGMGFLFLVMMGYFIFDWSNDSFNNLTAEKSFESEKIIPHSSDDNIKKTQNKSDKNKQSINPLNNKKQNAEIVLEKLSIKTNSESQRKNTNTNTKHKKTDNYLARDQKAKSEFSSHTLNRNILIELRSDKTENSKENIQSTSLQRESITHDSILVNPLSRPTPLEILEFKFFKLKERPLAKASNLYFVNIIEKQKRPPLMWEVSYNLGKASRRLAQLDNPYNAKRNDQEAFLEQNRFAFRIRKPLSQKLFISTGLSMSFYRSKSEESINWINGIVEVEDQLITVLVDDGIQEEIFGTAIGLSTTQQTYVNYQQYYKLGLPISIGFNSSIKSKWAWSLQTGINLGLYQSSIGQVFESALPNGEFVSLNSLQQKKTLSSEWISEFSIIRNFRNNYSIYLGAKYNQDISNRFKSGSGINDKFRSLGVNIGILKKM